MRQWERGSVCPCAPIRFFFFLPNPGACRGTYAAQEGRTLHAARREVQDDTGRQAIEENCDQPNNNVLCSKVHGADGGKTLHQIAGTSRHWEE